VSVGVGAAGVDLTGILARCRFPAPGTAVNCAVSGGADSLALLVLAASSGCVTTAIHVDHGLRSGSADEADVVAEAAARFGARFVSLRVAVPPGPNLEARAREARYGALPPDVLTGHTADDQAETVLLNLLRGAGTAGLAGMRRDRRPLLDLRRTETAGLCAQLGLTPVVDPTNASLAHRRNRVRHQLLPLLEDVAERDVVPILVRQADLFRDDADLLDELAAAIDVTDARALAAAPRALARRAVRGWLAGDHPPDVATVERVLAVASGAARACDAGRGRRVERHGMRLELVSRPAEAAG
jgi:tRNA(Ile)-lysidine synthase